MQLLKYDSATEPDSAYFVSHFLDQDSDEREFDEDAPERWQKSDVSDFFNETYHDVFPGALAEEVHDFVRLVAHPFRRCFDSPAKSPKNVEIESAISNKGTPGYCTFIREEGKFIARPLVDWMFYGHNLRRKHYYTSDTRIALLYHDIDCHKDHQTQADAEQARHLIEKESSAWFGVSPLFVASNRGENGYLKVDLAGVDPQTANEVFDEYQTAIRLLFAKHRILADFEIKGTVTWIDNEGKLHAGRYGKLPMCASRWDSRWHRSLVTAKKVTIGEIQAFIKKVNADVSAEDIAGLEKTKHRANATLNCQVGADNCVDGDLASHNLSEISCDSTLIEKPIEVSLEEDQPSPSPSRRATKVDSDEIVAIGEETDSFVRQRRALLIFARTLKRIPTVEEALGFIQKNRLYTGAWDNPARRGRVRGILKYISKTFDANKCTKQGQTVNIGKYDAWAKAKFPNGIGGGKRRFVTDDFQVREIRICGQINWKFISVFISICEYCLLVEPNPDGSLPQERAKELWKCLHTKGLITTCFDDRKWAACRDALEKHGIIKTIRYKAPGKAWKWSVGQFFPLLGLWKTKKQPSSCAAISWMDFITIASITRETQQGQHNSLLYKKDVTNYLFKHLQPVRPPPGIKSV